MMNRQLTLAPGEYRTARDAEGFAKLFARQPGLNLVDAALAVAASFRESLDIEGVRDSLVDLVRGARAEIARGSGSAAALCGYLRGQQGFAGNERDYQDPDNSMLDLVLARRTGIPISLAVVYIAVARGCGLQAQGINFPGHVLVGIESNRRRYFIDPFAGEVIDREECASRLRAAGGFASNLEQHLAPADTLTLTARMLANLKRIYLDRGDDERALGACARILAIAPDSLGDLYDLAAIYERLGSPQGARQALTDLRGRLDDPEIRGALDARIADLRYVQPPSLH